MKWKHFDPTRSITTESKVTVHQILWAQSIPYCVALVESVKFPPDIIDDLFAVCLRNFGLPSHVHNVVGPILFQVEHVAVHGLKRLVAY